MKNKKWIVAVIFGIVAGGLHLTYVRGLEKQKTGGALTSVLAVKKTVRSGEKITKEVLGMRQIPAAYVDPRAVLSDRLDKVLGLTASLELMPGQGVLWTDFTSRLDESESDLASQIESGKRAVTIQVDKSLSMGGLLRPGHRVDILGTFAENRDMVAKERVTATLLQNVLVLATGSRQKNESEAKKVRFSTVTLAVGLEEAELIALASDSGKLSIVLRGHQDLSIVKDVPEKKMKDVFDADCRNSLQSSKRATSFLGIERIREE